MLKKVKLPYGFQDFLPQECYNKTLIEEKLSEVYKSYGYSKVETPTMEYYDTFHDVYRPDKLKTMFKLTDNDGSLLALRPDITLQISRLAAGLDSKYPNRLYYCENSFEYQDSCDTARTREFAQVGVELLGETGIAGEIEIITLAIESFLRAGLDNFTVEIGNNNFFKGMMSDSGLSKEDTVELTELINSKNALGMEMLLQRSGVSKELSMRLLELPSLFGDESVLSRAQQVTNNSVALSALERVRRIYNALKSCGYGKYISLDLGMLHGLNYYSGLVIKGYSENLGLCLLDGGRYDGICPSFGYSSGAVGFAIGTKRLLSALDEAGKLKQLPSCDAAYISDGSDVTAEHAFCKKVREHGARMVKLFCDKRGLIEYCENNRIKQIYSFENGRMIQLDKERV